MTTPFASASEKLSAIRTASSLRQKIARLKSYQADVAKRTSAAVTEFAALKKTQSDFLSHHPAYYLHPHLVKELKAIQSELLDLQTYARELDECKHMIPTLEAEWRALNRAVNQSHTYMDTVVSVRVNGLVDGAITIPAEFTVGDVLDRFDGSTVQYDDVVLNDVPAVDKGLLFNSLFIEGAEIQLY
jgi:hypothetical protein